MIPIVNQIPTLILGMDVSHGSPGRADIPSIAAVCLVFSVHYFASSKDLYFHPLNTPICSCKI